MTTPDVRALLVLAASELNTSELRALAQQVSRGGPGWLIRQISNLREGQWYVEGRKSASTTRSGFDRERIEEHDSVIRKVETLLLKEAGMSKTSAIKQIISSIKSDASSANAHLPASTKIAFDVWLARLLDEVPPSLVLHHASKIRNAVVHGSMSRSSWPLSHTDD